MSSEADKLAALLDAAGKKTAPGVVVLASGGLDSTLLLHWARYLNLHPIALLINYGQKHIQELSRAIQYCSDRKIPFHTMNVDLGIDSGLTGDNVTGQYQSVSQWHVPGRNTIFVGLAASLAESVGAKKIWFGANYEDRINRFPDCYQEWVYSMNESLAKAGSYPIELEAPLLGMRKTTIEALANHLGIKSDEVFSGYGE